MEEIYSFGYWVRRRRKALDLTQDDLAQCVGCATVTIRKIEIDARRPSSQIAERLAACLDIPPAERDAFLQAARAERPTDQLPAPNAAIELPARPHPAIPHRSMLPQPPHRLIGHTQLLAEICSLLQHSQQRLLTLTGPGGVGKTRLAIEVGHMLRDSFPASVAFVDLSTVTDPAAVLPTIARAFGLPDSIRVRPLDQLATLLHDQRLLLILDNLEQVRDSAPQIAELLAAISTLQILATSRAPLRIGPEREQSIPPLLDTLDGGAPAVELFVERAQSVRPEFDRATAQEQTLAAICARLDGLPLAIELAAARIRIFSPESLLARLDRRLTLLTGGPRDLPARQQTLRATIDWSYDLLDADERALFAQLSVFAGGFTLTAAEAVCQMHHARVDQSLESLVTHSLILRSETETGEPHFHMLESIREYASEWLVVAETGQQLRERHLAFLLELAERAEPRLFGPDQLSWVNQLERERGNLLAALEWSLGPARAPTDPLLLQGLRLASALWWFWYLRGYLSEGRNWIERGLGLIEAAHPEIQAAAGYRAAALAFRLGEYRRAAELAEQSLQRSQALGDDGGAAFARGVLAFAALLQGDPVQAEALAAAARPALQHPWAVAVVLVAEGVAARFQGQLTRGNQLLSEALATFRSLGDAWGTATALGELGILTAAHYGDWQRAASLIEESLALSRALGDRVSMAHAIHRLGRVARQRGDVERALALLNEQIEMFRRLGDRAGMAYAVWEAAALEAARGRFLESAQLFGLAEQLSAAINLALSHDQVEYDEWRVRVRAALGDEPFAAAIAAGHHIPIEQVVDRIKG
jgi:predicted ATPase/transcriptional regulator with XRE-family HTH domain